MAETTSDARDEVRLPPGELGAPPAPLVALTRATHRGAPLVPVVELDTARREWVLADSDGHPLATVTDDRVTGQTLAAPTMVTRWAEIEVELAEHSTVEVLDRVEQALLAAGASRSESWSKLGRMLVNRLPPPARGQGQVTAPQPGTWCWPTSGSMPTRSG